MNQMIENILDIDINPVMILIHITSLGEGFIITPNYKDLKNKMIKS